MNRNYKIVDGIYLSIDKYELDLHNDYDFTGLKYSVEKRHLELNWAVAKGDWVKSKLPTALSIEFDEVSEFRFFPRDEELPFTEDDCLNIFGYWTDEGWADGVMMVDEEAADPHWLTALDFMSGAILAVQAKNSQAIIKS